VQRGDALRRLLVADVVVLIDLGLGADALVTAARRRDLDLAAVVLRIARERTIFRKAVAISSSCVGTPAAAGRRYLN